jgi:hypothetical protein
MPVAADGQQVLSARGDAVRTLLVPRGVHDYKFIVDGKWRPAPADPVARDQAVGAIRMGGGPRRVEADGRSPGREARQGGPCRVVGAPGTRPFQQPHTHSQP